MKKLIISLLVLFAGISCVFASEYTKFSKKFIKHFKDCDIYEETVTSNFEDSNFTTNRRILGWKNGMCRYMEIITSKEGSYKLDCRFAEIQLDDLYLAMKDRSNKPEKYNLDIFQPKVDPKTGETTYITNGSTVIKGNKAYIVWAKYQNNPYICRSERLK